MTPLDLARMGDRNPDPNTVEWLEAIKSGQSILQELSPAALQRDEGNANAPSVVARDAAKLPSTDIHDDVITMDRCSVKDVLEGKNAMAVVSPSYIESIRTKKVIRNVFFGIVYIGTDTVLHRNFAIKAFNTDIISGGNSADVQTVEETFLKEMKVKHLLTVHASTKALYIQLTRSCFIKAFSLFRHPNIDILRLFYFRRCQRLLLSCA